MYPLYRCFFQQVVPYCLSIISKSNVIQNNKQIILISLNPEEFKLAKDKSNDAWETMCNMVCDRLGIKIIDEHDLLWLNNRPLH